MAILDLQQKAIESETERLRQAGSKVLGLRVDIADRDQIDAAYAAVRETLGPIAIVIANAGYSEPAVFSEMSRSRWDRMISVNLSGNLPYHSGGATGHALSENGAASSPSRRKPLNQVRLTVRTTPASKGGVIGLTKALGMELARDGITVNTIPPSLVATPMMERETAEGSFPGLDVVAPMIPIGRAGTPDDIADACEFLCSDKAGYITGQQINVNGGSYM